MASTKADVNLADEEDRWSLIAEAEKGRFDFVQMLVRYGVNVNTADSKGQTALTTAVQHGHLKIAYYLLECEADINAVYTGRFGYRGTALTKALEKSHLNLAKRMMKSGADMSIGST